MFLVIPVVYILIAVFIYQDALRLRKKGVSVYPGLIVGLILIGEYLSFWVSALSIFLFSSSSLLAFVPLIVYLTLRFTKYRNLALKGNPPLPPAPRWAFWFMIGAILIPFLFVAFIGLTLFNNW